MDETRLNELAADLDAVADDLCRLADDVQRAIGSEMDGGAQ